MYTIHATGEVVRCAPGVVFVVADNTNGSGDETGQYAGTNQANAALVNRFKRMVRVDYMSKRQETAALVNHTNVSWDAAEHVTTFMAHARKLPAMEGVVLSLRQMVGFVNTVKDGFNAKSAFEVAILSRLPNAERAALETLATLQWTEAFENLLLGITPAAEGLAPADSAASNAFDDDVTASLNR
jgi:MoxR-like ATPase